MIVQVKLFALARQLAETETLPLEVPEPATVGRLRAALAERVPQLAAVSGHLLFAVDQQYAADTAEIPAAAEVACFPPVSGG